MHYKQDSVTFHTKCITSRGPAPNQKADIDVNDKKKGERERERRRKLSLDAATGVGAPEDDIVLTTQLREPGGRRVGQ